MNRRLLAALGELINRIFPMPPTPHVPPLPPARTLAELEADIEVWERANPGDRPAPIWCADELVTGSAAPTPPWGAATPAGAHATSPASAGVGAGGPHTEPLAEWEKELIYEVRRGRAEKDLAAIAAAILRAHDVIGAPIYADQIAQAILDRYELVNEGGNT